MKVNKIKEKVAAKVAKGKGKVAAKCGKGKACAAVALACGVAASLVGCQGLTSPSRSQNMTIRNCTINVYGRGTETNDVAGVEIASQAMSIENSGSETQAATPTQTTDVKPDIDVSVPVTRGGAASAALKDACADGACPE